MLRDAVVWLWYARVVHGSLLSKPTAMYSGENAVSIAQWGGYSNTLITQCGNQQKQKGPVFSKTAISVCQSQLYCTFLSPNSARWTR
jgi:hypothetical protein